jgi:hypothetical protein
MGGVVVGASAAGIVGALLAAPVIASGKEIMSYLYAKILSQEPFPSVQEASKEAQNSWSEQLQPLFTPWRWFIVRWQSHRQRAKEQPQ